MVHADPVILISMFLLIGGAIQYLLNMFYQTPKSSNLYMLCCAFGLLSYFLANSYVLYSLFLFFVFILYIYVGNFTFNASRLFKFFVITLSCISLYFVHSSAVKPEAASLFMIITMFLSLPAISRTNIDQNNFALLKTIHFVFRLLVVFLSVQMGFIYQPEPLHLILVISAYVGFSYWQHKSYNKNNEEHLLSFFLLLLVFCCSVPAGLLYSYVLLLYISEYKEDCLYGHNFNSLSMVTWLSPIGIKTIASFYILSKAAGTTENTYTLFGLLMIGVWFSSYRTGKHREKLVESNKNKAYQKALWLLLALFLFVGSTNVI